MWVRYIHDAPRHRPPPGWCRIEPLERRSHRAGADDPERFARDLSRLGAAMSHVPQRFRDGRCRGPPGHPTRYGTGRRWPAGAAFTEPGIHYVRGAWRLEHRPGPDPGGKDLPPCRYWNILLYSRFLNSLDYRHRVVARSAATSTVTDGQYRFVLAGRDPGLPGYDWLDTEGRPFGLFVMRFLQPALRTDAAAGSPA